MRTIYKKDTHIQTPETEKSILEFQRNKLQSYSILGSFSLRHFFHLSNRQKRIIFFTYLHVYSELLLYSEL